MKHFKVGDTVRLKKNAYQYNDDPAFVVGATGVVVFVSNVEAIYVRLDIEPRNPNTYDEWIFYPRELEVV